MLQWLQRNTFRMVSLRKLPPKATGGGAGGLDREVAGVAGDLWAQADAFMGVRPNRDPLLGSRQPGAAYAYPYGLFEEALDKDAHLTAIVTQRKAAVLAWQRQVVPAGTSPDALAAARLVEAALQRIGSGFERDLAELLDAIPYGLAVSEVLWEHAPWPADPASGVPGGLDAVPDGPAAPLPAQCLLPAALRSRHPRRFVFGADSALRLLTPDNSVTGEALAPCKFLVFAPYGRHEDPYGLPALRSVWWLAYFKRQVMRFWVLFCEKFGTPTTVLKHPLGATDREKAAYRRIIGTLQQETGLIVPEGVELALLEAQRSGTVETYSQLLRFLNEEMSKALLGQTLSTEATERGARSLGEVHLAVRRDIVRQDAQALMALVNGQLVQWIVDLNFPAGRRCYPRWQLDPPGPDDLALQLEIDAFFLQQGLSLDPAELYARYGRKAAATGSGSPGASGGGSLEHRPGLDNFKPAA